MGEPHPVFAAARADNGPEVLRLLSLEPSLVSEREPTNNWTLLHLFARLSNASMVSQLLALGADCEARDAAFRSPLHHAARADMEASRLPSDSAPATSTTSDRAAAIVATLEALLKAGARVTARDQFGFTALHHSAQAGHGSTIEYLLGLSSGPLLVSRPPLEAESNAEERPLHVAAQGGHAATVQLLLKHGAHPCKTNYVGQTPLHLAVLGGDSPAALATVRELCSHRWRVDVNAPTPAGTTPLHLAAEHGHTRCVRALLAAPSVGRHGGDRVVNLGARDCKGRTAYDLALENQFEDTVEVLAAALQTGQATREEVEAAEEEILKKAMSDVRVSGRIPTIREGEAEGEAEADAASMDDDE